MTGFEGPAMLLIIIIGIPVICSTIYKIAKLLVNHHQGQMSKEDREIMNELYDGLKSLNRRIENLETIMKERNRHE